MIARLARFANDSYYLLQTPHPLRQKAALLFHLFRPSRKMMGFDISYFDRPSFKHLYREIFVRQYYYYRANTTLPWSSIAVPTWTWPLSTSNGFIPTPASRPSNPTLGHLHFSTEMSVKIVSRVLSPTIVLCGMRMEKLSSSSITADEYREFPSARHKHSRPRSKAFRFY